MTIEAQVVNLDLPAPEPVRRPRASRWRIALPVVLLLSLGLLWWRSYSVADVVLVGGWKGQFNAIRTYEGRVLFVVSSRSFGESEFGVIRHTRVELLATPTIVVTGGSGTQGGGGGGGGGLFGYYYDLFEYLRGEMTLPAESASTISDVHAMAGMYFLRDSDDFEPRTDLLLDISFVHIGIVLLLWLLLVLWRLFCRRQLVKQGHCLVCGYDLRATPGRCPECGTVVEALHEVGSREVSTPRTK